MNTRGLFITLEGGEGTGKSTQSGLLAEGLRRQKYDVITTREPGGTPEAEKIRELLVRRDGGNWTPMAETLLFFAARAMHVHTLVKPALAAGKIVICDRFTDSTRAYQCYGHGMELRIVDELTRLSLDGFEPDLTFVLDIDPQTGLQRSGRRLSGEGSAEDRFEKLDIAFHERLKHGFIEIAETYPDRCVVINANRSVEPIAAEILHHALEKLKAFASARGREQGIKNAL